MPTTKRALQVLLMITKYRPDELPSARFHRQCSLVTTVRVKREADVSRIPCNYIWVEWFIDVIKAFSQQVENPNNS